MTCDRRLGEFDPGFGESLSKLAASGDREGFFRLGTFCPNLEPLSNDRLEEDEPDSVCVWDREWPEELVAEPHDFDCRSEASFGTSFGVAEGRRSADGRGTRLAPRDCD